MREVQDHYFRLAKKEGYLSRAAYKLREIDDRRRILHQGDRVLDCGAAPGSWLQVAAQRIGPGGRIVGIDLEPASPAARAANVRVIQGDITGVSADELLGDLSAFDVVLSDMAPKTTGDRTIDHHGSVRLCRAVMALWPRVLRSGGRLVMKVLEGEAYPDLLGEARGCFEQVKGFKPKASRGPSTEMYIVAEGYQSRRHAEERQADLKSACREEESVRGRPRGPAGPPPRGW